MNILVIGGAGYIGSHVVCSLLDKGHTVTVYDNLSSGCRENLFDRARFVQGDILEYAALEKTMGAGFDGVIHLAAFKAAGESMVAPEKYAVNNCTGTINILNAASACKVKHFIFSSSAAVYGRPEYLPIDEKHPTNPENFYGFTKLEIERLLHWYSRLRDMRFGALRYFNAAGYDQQGRVSGLEKNPQNLLPAVMEVAAGMRKRLSVYGNDWDTRDGTGVRDYIHVTDLAQAHCLALEYIVDRKINLTVNLGSENGISVQEMVDHARAITGKPIPVECVGRRDGDTATVLASAKYARETLGWEARHSDVATLISSTWEVYKNRMKP
jgi:UDP-glucose 4-epimerase